MPAGSSKRCARAPSTATSRRSSPPRQTATTADGFATPRAGRTSGAASTPSSPSARAGQSGGIRPAFISDYLRRHGADGWVTVDPGAWNTGDHHGAGFVQWTGSQAQRDALARVADLSNAVRAVPREALDREPRAAELIEQARWRVLRAQTSCNFYWGEAWVQRCHHDLDAAAAHFDQALNVLRTGK